MWWPTRPRAHQDSLRRRCEDYIRSVNLPAGQRLTVQDLCDHLARINGRPIHLVPYALPNWAPDGLLISDGESDVIVFEQRLAPVHRQQVVLHEIGHMICNHGTALAMTGESSERLLSALMSAETSTRILPSLNPDMVRRVLGREHAHHDHEVEAEAVGSLLGRRISAWSTQRSYPVPPEAQALAERLVSLMEDSRPQGENE